jgi:hypothetical protein
MLALILLCPLMDTLERPPEKKPAVPDFSPKKLYVDKSMEMSFFPFMPLKQAPVPGPDNRDFLQLDNAMIISIS